eukprot:NODE_1964_length_1025_cov_412.205155.p1 GENE.NODE_1964_length_1025_cov_412.205155~~NODE_1964_length_1025_cov_412.205155.p1  ORF type:complete len:327 (-),score=46.46 NODE_1964_length_1025_cov_412.205155:28-963(-)
MGEWMACVTSAPRSGPCLYEGRVRSEHGNLVLWSSASPKTVKDGAVLSSNLVERLWRVDWLYEALIVTVLALALLLSAYSTFTSESMQVDYVSIDGEPRHLHVPLLETSPPHWASFLLTMCFEFLWAHSLNRQLCVRAICSFDGAMLISSILVTDLAYVTSVYMVLLPAGLFSWWSVVHDGVTTLVTSVGSGAAIACLDGYFQQGGMSQRKVKMTATGTMLLWHCWMYARVRIPHAEMLWRSGDVMPRIEQCYWYWMSCAAPRVVYLTARANVVVYLGKALFRYYSGCVLAFNRPGYDHFVRSSELPTEEE